VAVAAKSNPTAKSKAAAGPADPKPAAESDDDAATTDGKDDTPTLAAKLVCALPLPPHPRAWPFPREMGLAGLPHTSFRPGLQLVLCADDGCCLCVGAEIHAHVATEARVRHYQQCAPSPSLLPIARIS
jgi:hypothetical protein